MATVTVHLNGIPYAVACEDGQEDRLHRLAQQVDDTIRGILARGATGTEPHILAVTCLVLADRVFDLMEATALAEKQAADHKAADGALEEAAAQVDALSNQIEWLAERLKRA